MTQVPHADRDASELPGSRIDSVPPPAEDPFFVNGDDGRAILPAYFHGTPEPAPTRPAPCKAPGEHDELAWYHEHYEALLRERNELLGKLDAAEAEVLQLEDEIYAMVERA